MLELVVKKLKNTPLANVMFPTTEKMASFAQMIQASETMVEKIISFMDG
jgi:hypothetical protein